MQSVLNHGSSRTTSIWFTIQHPRFLDQDPCPDGISVASLADLYVCCCHWDGTFQFSVMNSGEEKRYPHTLGQDEPSSIPLPVGKAHD